MGGTKVLKNQRVKELSNQETQMEDLTLEMLIQWIQIIIHKVFRADILIVYRKTSSWTPNEEK